MFVQFTCPVSDVSHPIVANSKLATGTKSDTGQSLTGVLHLLEQFLEHPNGSFDSALAQKRFVSF